MLISQQPCFELPARPRVPHVEATTRGWTVRDAHVYVDDGISGAEFDKRPGLQAMLAAAERSAFRVVVVSEQKSIGREAVETQFVMKRLDKFGVKVWSYMDDRSLTPTNAIEKVTSAVRAFGDEAHREDTSRRNHESHAAKHSRGQVVGGRVFGYRNVDVLAGLDAHGRPLRSHVVRMVDDAEATVVRRIFELCASGLGLKSITKTLNAEGASAPKPFVRKDAFGLSPVGAWCPSTVRAVLRREDYRGVYVWNKTRKRDEWGAVRQRPRPESEWQRTEIPEWRIVSDDLWNRVVERLKESEERSARFSNGKLIGRPKKQAVTNLLANLATCGVCGGGLVVETYKTTTGKPRAAHYVCNRRRAYGKCANALRIAVDVMNEAVLWAVEEHALTPEAIEAVVILSERADEVSARERLEREAKDVEKRIGRFVAAIEAGVDAASVAAKLRELEGRKAAIRDELADLRPVPRIAAQVVEGRLAEWRRLLRASVTQGRMVLDRVLAGRIVFTPTADGAGYTFEAPTRFDRLFSGVAFSMRPTTPLAPEFAARLAADAETDGSEAIGTEDTFDGDYGRLLERAVRKLRNRTEVASPPGPGPDAVLLRLHAPFDGEARTGSVELPRSAPR